MWNVPADHEIFQELNPAQWLWYLHNFLKDQEEKFNLQRDFVEYQASFIEPQAVHKIREARNKAIEIDDSSFAKGVQDIFGRPLPGVQASDSNKQSHDIDMNELIKNIGSMKKPNKDASLNYRYWAQLDLE